MDSRYERSRDHGCGGIDEDEPGRGRCWTEADALCAATEVRKKAERIL